MLTKKIDEIKAKSLSDIQKAVSERELFGVKVKYLGRKGKLTGDPAELFSGDFWTGTQAVKLGLADATATPWAAMQETFGTTHYRDYSPEPSMWENVIRNVSMKLPLGLMDSNTKLQEIL